MAKEKKSAEDRERIFHAICEDVAAGDSLRAASARHGWTHWNVIKRCENKPEWRALYESARLANGDAQGSKITDRALELLNADNVTSEEVQAARVAIDALKWVAARQNGKNWGENKTTTHELGGNFVQALEAIEDRAGKAKVIEADKVIEVSVEEGRH